jgi:hypothetical protein
MVEYLREQGGRRGVGREMCGGLEPGPLSAKLSGLASGHVLFIKPTLLVSYGT